ncbi:MAG: hypothetical protein ACR2M1_05280 [Gemmatimonadaceae bacterium]
MTTTLRNIFQNAEITRAQRSRLHYVMTVDSATPCSMDYELVARGLLVSVIGENGPCTVAINPEAQDAFDQFGACILPIVHGSVQSYIVDVLAPSASTNEAEPFTFTPLLYAKSDEVACEKARAFYGDMAIALWAQTSVDEYHRAVEL